MKKIEINALDPPSHRTRLTLLIIRLYFRYLYDLTAVRYTLRSDDNGFFTVNQRIANLVTFARHHISATRARRRAPQWSRHSKRYI